MTPLPFRSAILVSAAAVGLCFLPLFSLLGYESAAAMGAVLGILVLVRSLRLLGLAEQGPLLDATAEHGPLDRFLAMLPAHLALLLPPLLILSLNALRVKNCDLGLGLRFFIVIPAVSVVAGQALAFAVAGVVPWRRLRVPLALALVGAQTLAFGWRLAWDPPIAGHTWTIGWFAGSIYDEALNLPSSLLWARLGVLCGSALLLLGLETAWRWRALRPLGGTLVALLAAATAVGALHLQRADLGIQHDQASVKAALGGHLQSEHFDIWYDPGSLDDEQRRLLVEDHEFRYAELAAWFDEDPVAWRGRRIDSFVYPGRGMQQRLMGSRNTLVARPWTHQMHIRWDGYGDNALAHELAHLFTAPFGSGPGQLAGRHGGLGVDLGLVEGIARAADAPPDELTAHQASRAMRELGLAPDLRRLFDISGFWSQPGRRAYTMVGSFVEWLVETRGIAPFKQVYADGDFQAAYGRPVEALVGEWEAWVDQVPLSDSERALAGYRYRAPSIFQKVCARTMAELERQAAMAADRGELDEALALRERITALQPKNPDHALDIARLRRRMGDRDAALAALAELLSRPNLADLRRIQAQELEADIRWEAGQDRAASELYAGCLAEGLDEARIRRLVVKQAGAGSALDEVRERARRYLVDDESGRSNRLWSALRWAEAAPDDPLARYLVGRVLLQSREYEDAATWLAGPPGTIPQATVDDERRLLLAEALLHAGRLDQADATYTALATSTTSSRVRSLAVEGAARARFKEGRKP